MSGWQSVGRDLVFVPPDVGGSVRIGNIEWVEALSQNSAEGCIHVSIGNSNYAPYGAFSGSRTSDGGGIGHMSLAYQDSRSPGGGAWGHYVEAFVAADAHPDNTLFGVEYAAINERDTCPDVTPHQISPLGVVSVAQIGVDKPGRNGKEISSFFNFVNVTGKARAVAKKAFVFAFNSIKMIALMGRAFGEVMAMAKGHGFRWYDAAGNPGTTITCNTDNAAYAPHLDFTNGAVHFLDASGVSQFSFNTMTGNLYLGNTGWSPAPVKNYVGSVSLFVGGRKFRIPLYED